MLATAWCDKEEKGDMGMFKKGKSEVNRDINTGKELVVRLKEECKLIFLLNTINLTV
jgi:hypothetical protein